MTHIDDLPKPLDPDLAKASFLTNHLKAAITKSGAISFSEFMQQALYHPNLGFYNDPQFELGSFGHFITAPLISPLFAKCLAKEISSILPQKVYTILEIGAGTGQLASDLIHELTQQKCLPKAYLIHEISPSLSHKQKTLLQKKQASFFDRFHWIDEIKNLENVIVIANEVLDAISFDCFQIENDVIKERCVSFSNNQFHFENKHPRSNALMQDVKRLRKQFKLPDGYQSESHLKRKKWMASLSRQIKSGIIFLIDYGYGAREYYHPERVQGTLACFYKHHYHVNPFLYPGLQDISAHVNFTDVIETAHENDWELLGFTTQAAFLLSLGLLEEANNLEQALSTPEQFQLHQAIKSLTFPTEMGETIKVMALAKNIGPKLQGFQLKDRRRDL